VDLIHHQALGEHGDHFVLPYAVNVANMIPCGRYTLVVKVTARDVTERRRAFEVMADEDGRLVVSPARPERPTHTWWTGQRTAISG
jgi:hypothetical protein